MNIAHLIIVCGLLVILFAVFWLLNEVDDD